MLTIIFHDMSEGVLSVSRFFSVFFFSFREVEGLSVSIQN